MKRRNLLLSLLAMPFVKLSASTKPTEVRSFTRPSDNQNAIGAEVEKWDKLLSYKENNTFLFCNRGGTRIFSIYDPRTGNPVLMESIFVCYFTNEESLRDLDSGKLPDRDQLMVTPHGGRIQSVAFNLASGRFTPEYVSAKIAKAVEVVRGA